MQFPMTGVRSSNSSESKPSLSVVVPLAPGETQWPGLWSDLEVTLPPRAEVVFVSAGSFRVEVDPRIRVVESMPGRGRQLNRGAEEAEGEWLWFLHADTRLDRRAVNSALSAVRKDEKKTLYYYDLEFSPDGPRLMALNTHGARWRSRRLGMPYGDQGFLLHRSLWETAGRFPEDAPYGEDHLLAWKVRDLGGKLKPTGVPIQTSARKYRDGGWLRVTLKTMALGALQSTPHWWKRIRKRELQRP